MRHWIPVVLLAAGLAACMPEPYQATPPPREGTIQLIVRVDDIGLLHTTNEVARRLLDSSIVTDFSLVVNSGWYGEAVSIFRGRPGRSVGVQLTLTAPWRFYKWSPLTLAGRNSPLLDGFGFFRPQLNLNANHAVLNSTNGARDSLWVIREFRAQLRRAISAGLEVAYLHYPQHLDLHPPYLRNILEQLAYEFQIGITGYFDATPVMFPTTAQRAEPEKIEQELVGLINRLTPGRWELALPAADTTPEYYAAGAADSTEVRLRAHRIRALQSNIILALCMERGIELVSYRQLLEKAGLWRRPYTSKSDSY